MPTFRKAMNDELTDCAARVLQQFDNHLPLRVAKLRIDFIRAYGDRNDDAELVGDALKKNGIRAYGIAKILSLKDRVMGRGDCEILIDHDFWEESGEETKEALVDHELTHLQIKLDKNQIAVTDDIGRPKLKLRKHSFEIGWFTEVAARHGVHSIERQQAKQMMEQSGQIYWPEIANATTGRFGKIGNDVTENAGKKLAKQGVSVTVRRAVEENHV